MTPADRMYATSLNAYTTVTDDHGVTWTPFDYETFWGTLRVWSSPLGTLTTAGLIRHRLTTMEAAA